MVVILIFAGCEGVLAKSACSLLSEAEVTAVLGEPVGKPVDQVITKGEGTNAAVSMCQFKTKVPPKAPKTLSLMVRENKQAPEGADKIALKMKKTGFQNVRPIAGVGDQAVWAATTVQRRFTGVLTVIKGKTLLVVTVVGVGDDSTSLEKAKGAALKAVAKS